MARMRDACLAFADRLAAARKSAALISMRVIETPAISRPRESMQAASIHITVPKGIPLTSQDFGLLVLGLVAPIETVPRKLKECARCWVISGSLFKYVDCRFTTREQIQALAKRCMFASWTPSSRAWLLRPEKEADGGCLSADAHAFQVTPHGAKSCYPGKRMVAGRGCAVTFIILWLIEARRNYFRSSVWL